MTQPWGDGDVHTRVMVRLHLTAASISSVCVVVFIFTINDLIIKFNGVQPILNWFALMNPLDFPEVCCRQSSSWKVYFLKVRRFHTINAQICFSLLYCFSQLQGSSTVSVLRAMGTSWSSVFVLPPSASEFNWDQQLYFIRKSIFDRSQEWSARLQWHYCQTPLSGSTQPANSFPLSF